MSDDKIVELLTEIKNKALEECKDNSSTALSVFRVVGVFIDKKVRELEDEQST